MSSVDNPKYNTGEGVGSAESPQHQIEMPLFEASIDFDIQGGLVILNTGQIAEVTPPKFIPQGGDTSIYGPRVHPLPLHIDEAGDIVWRGEDYDPAKPTIGVEIEQLTMADYDGSWWNIAPNGETIVYPNGTTDHAEKRGHQPEILQTISEGGSEIGNIPAGHEEFVENTNELKEAKRRWLSQHGLISPPISLYPNSVRQVDITTHPYIQMLKSPDAMPRFLEYAPCASEQLNIQWSNPEAGAFAINAYQILQSVINLVTAASPARDGSFDTTLRQHYNDNPEFKAAVNAHDYAKLAEQIEGELGAFLDEVPYDWREFARANGSPSGGIITHAAPVDLESFLRDGDEQLRNNETMTISRTLGWHADRMRPDRGVVEINNLSHGGDHTHKMQAVEETVIKVIGALQAYFDNPDAEPIYNLDWSGVIPLPMERQDPDSRQDFVHVSRVNNLLTAMFGRERKLFTVDWAETTPKEIFDIFVDFTNNYSSEPIKQKSIDEIHATLDAVPDINTFRSANDVFAYFYEAGSSMTAAETLKIAHSVESELSVDQLLLRMAHYSTRHRRERVAQSTGTIALTEN